LTSLKHGFKGIKKDNQINNGSMVKETLILLSNT